MTPTPRPMPPTRWFRRVRDRRVILGLFRSGPPSLFEVCLEDGTRATMQLSAVRQALGVTRSAERDFQEAEMLASRAFRERRHDEWVTWPYPTLCPTTELPTETNTGGTA